MYKCPLGTIYGMGPALAATKLGIDIASANRITYAFFDNFKQMKSWMTKIKKYVLVMQNNIS